MHVDNHSIISQILNPFLSVSGSLSDAGTSIADIGFQSFFPAANPLRVAGKD
jgi:hypothetical protein